MQSNSSSSVVRVGLGIFVIKDARFILWGKRKNSHGPGTWNLPGGHLEFGESFIECAKREVKEETGLDIHNIRQGPYTNDFFVKEQKHYVTLFMIAEYSGGEPEIMEPEKCEEWKWVEWPEVPQPLFLPTQNLFDTPFDPTQV